MISLYTSRTWGIALLCLVSTLTYGQLSTSFTVDVNAAPLNTHADEVGTWVNSNVDRNTPAYRSLLQGLNVKSIRHGWQYTVMDEQDPDVFYASPFEPYVAVDNVVLERGIQGNILRDAAGRIGESMPLSQISQLRSQLNVEGYIILSMDGILYTGDHDPLLRDKDTEWKEDYYLANARRFAEWARDNGFDYIELGNENDYTDAEMYQGGYGGLWSAADYARYAYRMAEVVKEVHPNAKLGINGGLLGKVPERQAWFRDMANAEPRLQGIVDFIVVHKYEFWPHFGNWRDAVFAFGQIQPDIREAIASNFPGKPIHVTEVSGFGTEQLYPSFSPAWRGILNLEMMGNVFSTPEIEHVQQWPTRWYDDGMFDKDSDTYNWLGYSQKAYADHMKPHMIANGIDGEKPELSELRYFVARDPADNSLTAWFINHGQTAKTITLDLVNYTGTANYDDYALEIAGDRNGVNFGYGTEVSYRKRASKTAGSRPGGRTFSISVPPDGAAIAAFGGGATAPEPPLDDALGTIAFPSDIQRGQVITLDIPYTAAAEADIYAVLQKDSDGYGRYSTATPRVRVTPGEGTVQLSLTVRDDAPILDAWYQIVVAITAPGGGWNERRAFSYRKDIDLAAAPEAADLINTIASPNPIVANTVANVAVNFTATQARDIVVTLQGNNREGIGYEQAYGSTRVRVQAGTNAITVPVTVSPDIPIREGAFQMAAYIAPVSKTWSDQIHFRVASPLSTIPNPNSGGDVNLALGKPAAQSSTLYGTSATAARANDGNRSGTWADGSVSHTGCGTQDWWQVDLQATYALDEIKIFNRTDYGADLLSDYDVQVKNSGGTVVWSNYQADAAGSPTSIAVPGIGGRYVAIVHRDQGEGRCLHIAEVEVYGSSSAARQAAPPTGLGAAAEVSLGERDDMTVRPNPNAGAFAVEQSAPYPLEIVNVQGQLLRLVPPTGHRTAVDLTDLPAGVYLVRQRRTDAEPLVRRVVLR